MLISILRLRGTGNVTTFCSIFYEFSYVRSWFSWASWQKMVPQSFSFLPPPESGHVALSPEVCKEPAVVSSSGSIPMHSLGRAPDCHANWVLAPSWTQLNLSQPEEFPALISAPPLPPSEAPDLLLNIGHCFSCITQSRQGTTKLGYWNRWERRGKMQDEEARLMLT